MNSFEGSFLGDRGRIGEATVLECGVCWWVYDPARGDESRQIPPGTAFTELPPEWRCPACDNEKHQFMVLRRGREEQASQLEIGASAQAQALKARHDALLQAYARAGDRMRKLPVYNPLLDIQVHGLRAWDQGQLCIAATPWCMNILLIPGEGAKRPMEGTTREVQFPSGRYSFTAGVLEGVGPIESCSLFSPMQQFDDPAVVAEVARHALQALLAVQATAATPGDGRASDAPAMSRRRFLRGGRAPDDRAAAG